jgi:hypothetical protein
MPFELIDYESTGDKLFLTISPLPVEGRQVRSIDIYIMGEDSARNFDMIRKLDPEAQSMYYQHNISSRFEKEYKCLEDMQAYLVIHNPSRGLIDDHDLTNSTALYRVDYRVEDASGASSTPWLLLIMALLVLLIAGVVIGGIVLYRKSKRDRKSFFVKGSFLYYALQGPDGNVFYLGPEQYDRMYSSGSLAGFQFLGYTREIGGEIYNEAGMVVSAAAAVPAAYPADTGQMVSPAAPPIVLQAPEQQAVAPAVQMPQPAPEVQVQAQEGEPAPVQQLSQAP